MKYRLLMLSPVFEETALPEIVREDVAEVCAIMEYETAEDLAAKLLEAMQLLLDKLSATAEPA